MVGIHKALVYMLTDLNSEVKKNSGKAFSLFRFLLLFVLLEKLKTRFKLSFGQKSSDTGPKQQYMACEYLTKNIDKLLL